MFSLLVLSLALAAPLAAARTAVVPSDPTVIPAPFLVLVHPNSPSVLDGEQVRSFDAMEIRPDADICYKIRAFIFSTGSHPKLLRETTCGPTAPAAKNVDGEKPKLMPLDVKDKPAVGPER